MVHIRNTGVFQPDKKQGNELDCKDSQELPTTTIMPQRLLVNLLIYILTKQQTS